MTVDPRASRVFLRLHASDTKQNTYIKVRFQYETCLTFIESWCSHTGRYFREGLEAHHVSHMAYARTP